MRTAQIQRKTNETEISLTLNLDGTGKGSINTGIGFLDHMLTIFANQSLIDLSVEARGDLEVDDHHAVEDVGICLGEAIAMALGEKRGITRYGFFLLPMDESLGQVALDLSGRISFAYNATFEREFLGTLSTELIKEFFFAVAQNAKMNLNMKVEGENNHHKCEALFKAFGRALRMAVGIDERMKDKIPSTKGTLGGSP